MFDSQSKKNPRNTVLGFKIAEAEEARTPDNLIKSQVLYQLSYNPILNCSSGLENKKA